MLTEKRLRLSGVENTGRETGGLMLSISGLHNFYYCLPELHENIELEEFIGSPCSCLRRI